MPKIQLMPKTSIILIMTCVKIASPMSPENHSKFKRYFNKTFSTCGETNFLRGELKSPSGGNAKVKS